MEAGLGRLVLHQHPSVDLKDHLQGHLDELPLAHSIQPIAMAVATTPSKPLQHLRVFS